MKFAPKREKPCGECGGMFMPMNGKSMYCSVPCRIKAKSVVTRFGCWEVQAKTKTNGYPIIGLPDGRTKSASRAMMIALHGELTPDQHVCHHCDNRLCANPEHLFIGSRADNMADAARKKRMPRGEGHPNAKLTESQVAEIRRDRRPLRKIAADYGIGQTAVFKIKHNQYWRDVA